MDFWKMNGAGNDFIVLNDMARRIPDEKIGGLARRLCERHLSIGADGLMVVRPATADGDYRMLFYNSDGSEGEMCGNGSRCICRYGYENGLAGETQQVETVSGTVEGVRMDARRYRVRLNPPSVMEPARQAEAEGQVWLCAYVELGRPGLPHAAVEYPGLAGADENALRALGRALRYYPGFPKGANVTFYELAGPDRLIARTYERGVEDFTYACGTGAGSVAAALTLLGRVSGHAVAVDMPGGRLTIDAETAGDTVTAIYLTGPTNIVCKGEITDEELEMP